MVSNGMRIGVFDTIDINNLVVVDTLKNILNKTEWIKTDLEYQNAKWFKRKYINFLPFVVFKLTPGFSKDYFDLNEDDYPIFNEK